MTIHTSDGKENQHDQVDKAGKYSRKLNKLKKRLIRTKNNLFNKKQKTNEEAEIESSRYQSMPNLSKIILDDDDDDDEIDFIDSEEAAADQSESFENKSIFNNFKRKKSVSKKNLDLSKPLKETKLHSKRIKFF